MALKKYDKKEFYYWIPELDNIIEWIHDVKSVLIIQDIEADIIITMPLNRTMMQEFMEENPGEITEEAAKKLHDFDMYAYKYIELSYRAFSEFYWKRSEYNPPKSHWWWWLDEWFKGKIEINPDDVWIKWEKIRGK